MEPIYRAMLIYKTVVAITASQMGKTQGLLNIMGQRLDDDPVPMMYVGPTKSNVDSVIEPQVTAMLKSSTTLWAKTDQSRKSKKLSKIVNGANLRLAWAGSPTELASQAVHTVLVDEIDRMEPIPGEGDPVELAKARTSNYVDGRIVITSTPTGGNIDVERHAVTGIDHWKVADKDDLQSPIWSMWQEGTRFEWAVPCPHCQDYFIPRFRLLDWGEAKTSRVASRQTKMRCPSCAAMIDDTLDNREGMNARGEFLAPGQSVIDGEVRGEIPETDTASFWVSGLMSPWRTWGERVSDWLTAVRTGDQEKIRAIINTRFGEPYSFKGESPPPDVVRQCAGQYVTGQVPAGAKALTCFVDVQKRRLVYSVRAWGLSMESWLVDCGEIWGETDQPIVWSQLEELLEREYGEPPNTHQIKLCGIDSGFRPGDKWRRPDNMIYEFCMTHRGVLATKGRERLDKPFMASTIDVTMRGKVYKAGLQLWHLDTDYFKSWLMARIQWPPGQAGRWWVPQDVTDDYCSQVTAETRVAKPSGAAVWVKVRPQNHFLDCEAGNIALAQILGFHRRIASSRNTEATESGVEQPPPVPPGPAPAAPPMPTRQQPFGQWPGAGNSRPNWTTNWRR